MRSAAARLTVAIMALLALPALGALASCGTDAVAIEACRQIESARCDAMQACGLSADEAASCSNFYHDQCLHGVNNPDANLNPSTSDIDACVAAVKATAACARAGAANMAACPAAPLVPYAPANLAPCDVISLNAHLLAACATAIKYEPPPAPTSDAGSDAATDAPTD